MNDKNNQNAVANDSYLAAAQLNMVPGFDPLKFLHRIGSGENQEGEVGLELRYKKLWFRLKYPKGRMKLITRQITEQMAIFEAQIYLDRSDNEPVGNFTATCTYGQAPDFVKAAQDAALDHALTNAGFGVQFAASAPQAKIAGNPVTVPQQRVAPNTSQEGSGKEIVKGEAVPPLLKLVPKTAPVASGGVKTEPELAAIHNDAGQKEHEAVHNEAVSRKEHAAVHNEAVSQKELTAVDNESGSHEAPPVVQSKFAMSQKNMPAVKLDTFPVAAETELDRLPVEPVKAASSHTEESLTLPVGNSMGTVNRNEQAVQEKTVPISRFTQPATVTNATAKENAVQSAAVQPATVQKVESEEELPVAPVQTAAEAQPPRYAADMPVEEIMQLMTFEEARNVKVDVGTCNGWTMEQVADRRPPSLKWYVYGYKENNNILRAAAQIMLDSLSEKKAG